MRRRCPCCGLNLDHINALITALVRAAHHLAAAQRQSGRGRRDTTTLAAHAQALGRVGGKTGGVARAKALTPRRRKEIARLAATARWAKETERTKGRKP